MTMNKFELIEKLSQLGVSDAMYSLEGSTPSEKMVVEENDIQCCVYCSERGAKVDLKTFLSVDEAYDYLYSVFKIWKEEGYI